MTTQDELQLSITIKTSPCKALTFLGIENCIGEVMIMENDLSEMSDEQQVFTEKCCATRGYNK